MAGPRVLHASSASTRGGERSAGNPSLRRASRRLLGIVASCALASGACLDRPVTPSEPRTTDAVDDRVRLDAVDKIDLLFVIDNSSSMADKQEVLAQAVPDLLRRLVNPTCVRRQGDVDVAVEGQPDDPTARCPAGSHREFPAIKDIHVGVVTSSLGGHGADICDEGTETAGPTTNDHGRLVARDVGGAPIPTYRQTAGFFDWDPGKRHDPPGESDLAHLGSAFTTAVRGAGQNGCGYEATLEAFYRFLVDPDPPLAVTTAKHKDGTLVDPWATAVVEGRDEALLAQRAEFLRPDSLLAVVVLSDENDCSIVDGRLAPDVCEQPVLDAKGRPTGDCKVARTPWPERYRMDERTGPGGQTHPASYRAAMQYVGDGAGRSPFRMTRGTQACETDPRSKDCQSCSWESAAGDPRCKEVPQGQRSGEVPGADDSTNIRCWNQKQRFGIDLLHPTARYVDGLVSLSVYDRAGNLVRNPIYDDLPWQRAAEGGKKLTRARAAPRDPKHVFFAGIVGVPWQDVARVGEGGKPDLRLGFRPAQTTPGDPGIDWALVLGDRAKGTPPADPLMRESNQPRLAGERHPVTGDVLAKDAWNPINGNDWDAQKGDLMYACVFPTRKKTICAAPGDCSDCKPGGPDGKPSNAASRNPLCAPPVDPASPSGPAAFGVVDSAQYRAKAFPGLRFLEVMHDMQSDNAIAASICAKNLDDEGAPDFGYRPAVRSIVDQLKTQIPGRCLPRQLAAQEGRAPCLVLDARFAKDDAEPADPAELAACRRCDGKARRPITDRQITDNLSDDVTRYQCLCEVTQLEGDDLRRCQTDPEPGELSAKGGGWCYVDPAALAADPTRRYSAADVAAADQIVATCPTNLKRTLRFLDAATDGSTLFITCLGAPSGSVSPLLAAGPPVLGLPSRLSSTLGRLMASKKNGTPDPSEPKDTEKAEQGEPAEPKEAEKVEAKAEPEKPAEKPEPAPSSAPAAAPAAPAKPLPAWGDAIARLEQKWVRLETMLAVGVLICEIMSLCVWVFLKGISSPPGVSAAGVVFRAAITATVLGMAAWFGLRNQAPRFRTTATTIAVAAGLFLGRTWANVGVGYASELINWYQDASVLTLIGGLRRVGTRFTVWLAMLGASLATSSGKHINVDVVMRFLSPRVRVPAAVAAWTAASVVSMAACWGFVDHIAITAFGAKPSMSPTEKLGALAHEGAEHAFIFRRQVDLDAVVGWRVFAGRKYTQAMSGTEWNEHIKNGGYESRYTPEQVKALYVPADTQWVTPLVTIPGGKTPRALLVEDLNLLFPFGFLMIALKLLLRAMLVISGHVVVDPDAAHREDDVDEKVHEHHPEGEVL